MHKRSLHDRKTLFAPVFKVYKRFLKCQLLKQQPRRISKPEERLSIPQEIVSARCECQHKAPPERILTAVYHEIGSM